MATDPDQRPVALSKICTPPLIIKCPAGDMLPTVTALCTAPNLSLECEARHDCSIEHRNVHRSVRGMRLECLDYEMMYLHFSNRRTSVL